MSHEKAKTKRYRPPHYFIPHSTHWPLLGAFSLFLIAIGVVNIIHQTGGWFWFLLGSFGLAWMMFGWFGTVIQESNLNYHSHLQEQAFRWGMIWFIFSEVMFFSVLFGALFYVRLFVIPQLGGEYGSDATHQLLWPDFQAHWPLFKTPDPAAFAGPKDVISPWGIPTINTILLLSSAVCVTIAHWGLKNNNRKQVIIWLALTIILGVAFLGCQIHEYILAHHHYGLKLSSGIYGTTFFMLTGFHGAHVTLGAIMLSVILYRVIRGDFSAKQHFGFEACAWYWHFVDVVWLFLFVFVYWL